MGKFANQNLKGADFRGRDLSNADFSGARLQGADFSFADLYGANLSDAQLSGASLVGARLMDATATNTDFSDACLEGANLSCTDLSGSCFRYANLDYTHISGSKLCSASLDEATVFNACITNSDLNSCEFNAVFGGTVLCGVDLHSTQKLGHALIEEHNHIDHRTIELSAKSVTRKCPKYDALERFVEESGLGGSAVEYLRRLANMAKRVQEGSWEVHSGRNWVTSTLPERAVDWDIDISLAVEGLRTLLKQASSEQEMQAFLENNPALLARCLRGGHGRWVVPHLKLGSNHEADFVLGEKDSMGHHWTLVELESPKRPLFIKNGDPAEMLRHAIRQIQDWRTWIANNQAYARRAKEDGGMGLFDIDAESPGLIVIGRRESLDASARERRRRMCKELNIEIHTYDYLLDIAMGPGQGLGASD